MEIADCCICDLDQASFRVFRLLVFLWFPSCSLLVVVNCSLQLFIPCVSSCQCVGVVCHRAQRSFSLCFIFFPFSCSMNSLFLFCVDVFFLLKTKKDWSLRFASRSLLLQFSFSDILDG